VACACPTASSNHVSFRVPRPGTTTLPPPNQTQLLPSSFKLISTSNKLRGRQYAYQQAGPTSSPLSWSTRTDQAKATATYQVQLAGFSGLQEAFCSLAASPSYESESSSPFRELPVRFTNLLCSTSSPRPRTASTFHLRSRPMSSRSPRPAHSPPPRSTRSSGPSITNNVLPNNARSSTLSTLCGGPRR
jgi:hypothetical protein